MVAELCAVTTGKGRELNLVADDAKRDDDGEVDGKELEGEKKSDGAFCPRP